MEHHHYKVYYTSQLAPQNLSFVGKSSVVNPKYDLRFVEKIIFDQNLRFVIGYGK